jgi:arylsulfatase A-like enzyme
MRKPNLLFILIDDMGYKDLSCYGSEFYETPHIDSLAADGMRFTDAYASCPVCSPTRASILTGKYPAAVGVTNYIDWHGHNHPSQGRVIEVPYFRELPRTETTMARVLTDEGYDTWHVGKWHLGGRASYPDRQGFDVNLGGCEWGLPRNGYFSPFGIPTLDDPDGEGIYLTDYLTTKAVELIENRAGSDKPFYLNMWYHSVHTPIQAKPEKIRKYEEKAKRMGLDTRDAFVEGGFFPGEHKKTKRIQRRVVQSDPVYAAMIESLDENIGRLLKALKETGEEENTIVVFTSDNGGLATAEGAPTSNAPLSEGKGWMYEGGTREPLLVRWPGHVPAGTESDAIVTSPDFFPTMLDAAGYELRPDLHTDGESFLEALRGKRYARPRPVFWHYPHYGNQGGSPGASVRDGDWKLIEFFEDNHVELYNLRQDPGELRNMVEAEPERAESLRQALQTWKRDIHALIPVPNPEYEPWPDREPCGHFAPE